MGTYPTEHLPGAIISEIDVYISPETATYFRVGRDGVTRIEAFTKSGMHADIPYVRVWKGDQPVAEFCQHNILGVYFGEPATAEATLSVMPGVSGAPNPFLEGERLQDTAS